MSFGLGRAASSSRASGVRVAARPGRGDRDLAARRVLARRARRRRDDARRAARTPTCSGGCARSACSARSGSRPADRAAAGVEARAASRCPPPRPGSRVGRAGRGAGRRPDAAGRAERAAAGLRRCSARSRWPSPCGRRARRGGGATWPAWRAARRPPAEILRGGDLGRPRRTAATGARGGAARPRRALRHARARGALARHRRDDRVVRGAVVLLMLALASLLERLRDDPGTVGKRYQLTRRRRRAALPARSARCPACAAAGAALPGRRGRLVPARRAAAARRLPRRPHALRGAAAGRGPPAARPGEVEVGLGLADALGLRPGSTLAAQLPGGDEVRFRVAGVVRALENDGRIAWVQPDARCSRPTRRLTPALAVRPDRGRRPRRAWPRGLTALGAPPQRAGGATTRNAAFLGVLAACCAASGSPVGLVCLYALVQALAMTARERRGAVALLRAHRRASSATVALVLRRRRGGGRRCRPRSPASPARVAVLGAAGRARWPPASPTCRSRRRAGQILRRRRRPARARPRSRPRSSRGACCASPSSRGCGRSDDARRRRRPRPARALALAGCGAASAPTPARRRRRRCAPRCRPRRRRLPRARPGRAAGDAHRARGRGRARRARSPRFGQLTDTTCATRSRRRECRSSTGSAPPFTSTFRPQEALSGAGARRAPCARSTPRSPQAVFVTGDIIDNAQAERARPGAARSLHGGRVRPDTGAPGYTGVQQAADPDPFFYRPDFDAPRHPGPAGARRWRRSSPPGLRRALVPGARQPRPAGRRARCRPRRRSSGSPPATAAGRGGPLAPALGRRAAGRSARGRRRAAARRRRFRGAACRSPPTPTAGTSPPGELVARLRGVQRRAEGAAARASTTRSTSARRCAAIVLDTVDRARDALRAQPRPARLAGAAAARGRRPLGGGVHAQAARPVGERARRARALDATATSWPR